jgi:aminoglycoside phosphotransferase (APT) family kinase protein
VACDAGEVILRRPPLGHILPTAHDMGREYRVMTALADTAVPVPRTFHLGDSDSPLGAPFYVMERVVGHICRNSVPGGYAETPGDRRCVGEVLVDVLADLHMVDPAAVGLAEFGRPVGFMERQLRRWSQQWTASKTTDLPALDALRDDLVATRPEQRASAVVHGDWEMSTLGDPLADLGAMLAYWSQADDSEVLRRARIMAPVTAGEGFPTRAEIVERYARRTGIDLSDINWYQSFAYFKLAVVCQGIAARAAGGAMLGSGFDDAQRLVAPLVDAGRHLLA